MAQEPPQPPPDPAAPRSRLEDEVIEILHRTDRPPSKVVQFKSRAERERRSVADRVSRKSSAFQVTSVSLLAICVIFALLAAIVSDSSPFAGKLFALISIGALIALFFRAWRAPKQPTPKLWRGQEIDLRQSPAQELWNRFRDRPKRR